MCVNDLFSKIPSFISRLESCRSRLARPELQSEGVCLNCDGQTGDEVDAPRGWGAANREVANLAYSAGCARVRGVPQPAIPMTNVQTGCPAILLHDNPLGGEAVNLIASTEAGGNLHVHFQRRDDAESLNVVAETSTTGLDGSWSEVVDDGVNTVIAVTENGTDPDDVDISMVPGTDRQRFVRLKFTNP